MRIRWFGHSCFLLEPDSKHPKILTDPFDDSIGYPIPDVTPDLITESHQHFDHNAHRFIKGNYKLIKDPGNFEEFGTRITGVVTYHDKSHGSERGKNIVFKIEFPDEMNVVHLGDLGHILDEKTVRILRPVNILLIPVGGYFTIEPDEAKRICEQLKPNVIIPMHYRTKYMNFPIKSVESFLRHFPSNKVKNVDNPVKLSREELEKIVFEVWVMRI